MPRNATRCADVRLLPSDGPERPRLENVAVSNRRAHNAPQLAAREQSIVSKPWPPTGRGNEAQSVHAQAGRGCGQQRARHCYLWRSCDGPLSLQLRANKIVLYKLGHKPNFIQAASSKNSHHGHVVYRLTRATMTA